MGEIEKKKRISEMNKEEQEAFFGQATRAIVDKAHAKGRYTTHGDEKGVYRLYPDGHKEYLDAKDGESHD